MTESIHGQWLNHVGSLSSQAYTYDSAGRLREASGRLTSGAWTIRVYTYDANSNRMTKTSKPPNADGTCNPTATGTMKRYTHDFADRLTTTGVIYDTFGRITSIPAAESNGGGALTSSYFVNDLVKLQTQDKRTNTYELDPGPESPRTYARRSAAEAA